MLGNSNIIIVPRVALCRVNYFTLILTSAIRVHLYVEYSTDQSVRCDGCDHTEPNLLKGTFRKGNISLKEHSR